MVSTRASYLVEVRIPAVAVHASEARVKPWVNFLQGFWKGSLEKQYNSTTIWSWHGEKPFPVSFYLFADNLGIPQAIKEQKKINKPQFSLESSYYFNSPKCSRVLSPSNFSLPGFKMKEYFNGKYLFLHSATFTAGVFMVETCPRPQMTVVKTATDLVMFL